MEKLTHKQLTTLPEDIQQLYADAFRDLATHQYAPKCLGMIHAYYESQKKLARARKITRIVAKGRSR